MQAEGAKLDLGEIRNCDGGDLNEAYLLGRRYQAPTCYDPALCINKDRKNQAIFVQARREFPDLLLRVTARFPSERRQLVNRQKRWTEVVPQRVTICP